MLSIWNVTNLFTAIAIAVAAVPLLIQLYSLARGHETTNLCMDCQQCVAVCPVRKAVKQEYMGPRGIMIAARSGNRRMAEKGRIYSCTSCMSCVDACPRGLNVKHDMDHLRAALAKEGIGQMGAHKHIIKMASKHGNVFDEKPRWKPDIKKQKEKIDSFFDTYASIMNMDRERSAVETDTDTDTDTDTGAETGGSSSENGGD